MNYFWIAQIIGILTVITTALGLFQKENLNKALGHNIIKICNSLVILKTSEESKKTPKTSRCFLFFSRV